MHRKPSKIEVMPPNRKSPTKAMPPKGDEDAPSKMLQVTRMLV
jgi:hypothetical protein